MKAMSTMVLVIATAGLLLASLPVRADQTDDRIESSAKKTYVFKTVLKEDSIKIESQDGIVTLTGTVADPAHKTLAADTVEGLPGVQRVDNQITVNGPSGTENSDAWLSAKVKAALLFHRDVSAHNTQVAVQEGVATLTGEASSQAEKDLTTEYAKDVAGIKDVKNEMTVAGTPAGSSSSMSTKIDDASITAQIKLELLTHRSTSAISTKVATKNGVVTLTGTVRNAAERDLVNKLVKDIDGVKSVKNEMTVEVARTNG